MRLALAVVVALLCSCESARDLPTEQRQVVHVHEVAGVSKDVIYQRAIVWFAQAFRDSKSVIRSQDQASGTIVAKGILPGAFHRYGVRSDLGVTLTIEAKDGRYRTTFDDYEFISDGTRREVYTDSGEFDQAKEACTALDAELLAAVVAKPKDF